MKFRKIMFRSQPCCSCDFRNLKMQLHIRGQSTHILDVNGEESIAQIKVTFTIIKKTRRYIITSKLE